MVDRHYAEQALAALGDQVQRYNASTDERERWIIADAVRDAVREIPVELLTVLIGVGSEVPKLRVEVEECKRQIRLLGGDI